MSATEGQRIRTGTIFDYNESNINAGKKVIIHAGGTGSGKTFDTMITIFRLAISSSNIIITVTSESYPHLDVGAIRILEGICTPVGMWGRDSWNKSKSVWTSPTGSIIEFLSADRVGKALGARRTVLYGNEINHLSVDVWDEMARRSEIIIADFNPTAQFWLEEWIKNYDDTVIIKSNYLDNPFLPDTERKRIEKRASRDKNFKRIHLDCEYGIFDGLVFDTWQQVDGLPDGDIRYGLDWGYSNDPTAIVAVIETEDAYYIDEVLYRTGMLNSDIASYMSSNSITKGYDEIRADSAEPKSIQELCNAGFNVKPAQKGADSVRNGIDRLKSKRMYVTSRSVNLIKELRNYSWVVDKTGKATNKPMDAFNHAIDAIRYATEPRKIYKFSIM